METIIIQGKTYVIVSLLGHGKGGYSYLAECGGKRVTLKRIHHEPCDYYAFGNKMEAEQRDYQRLLDAGIRIPKMLAIDFEQECIVKEYIDGPTIFDLVARNEDVSIYLNQVREMAAQAKTAGLNIDYFPTNFIVSEGLIWYIDYECNEYMEQWDFEHWGRKYWTHTLEFEEYLVKHGLK